MGRKSIPTSASVISLDTSASSEYNHTISEGNYSGAGVVKEVKIEKRRNGVIGGFFNYSSRSGVKVVQSGDELEVDREKRDRISARVEERLKESLGSGSSQKK